MIDPVETAREAIKEMLPVEIGNYDGVSTLYAVISGLDTVPVYEADNRCNMVRSRIHVDVWQAASRPFDMAERIRTALIEADYQWSGTQEGDVMDAGVLWFGMSMGFSCDQEVDEI